MTASEARRRADAAALAARHEADMASAASAYSAAGVKAATGFAKAQQMRADIERRGGTVPPTLFVAGRYGSPVDMHAIEESITHGYSPSNGRRQLQGAAAVVSNKLDKELEALARARNDLRAREAQKASNRREEEAHEAEAQGTQARIDASIANREARTAAGQARLFKSFAGVKGGTYMIKFFDKTAKVLLGPVPIPDIGPENTLRELREQVQRIIGSKWNEQGFGEASFPKIKMPNPDKTLESYGVPPGSVFMSMQKVIYSGGSRGSRRNNSRRDTRTTRKNRNSH